MAIDMQNVKAACTDSLRTVRDVETTIVPKLVDLGGLVDGCIDNYIDDLAEHERNPELIPIHTEMILDMANAYQEFTERLKSEYARSYRKINRIYRNYTGYNLDE